MIIWIDKPLVLAMHDRQLAEHGGSSGVRDEGLLESALARPRQTWVYTQPPADIASLAASLAYGLAKNHLFVDGNKRTAAIACETFLMMNDVTLTADDAEWYVHILSLADGSISEDGFAAWLREHLQGVSGRILHEPQGQYCQSSG